MHDRPAKALPILIFVAVAAIAAFVLADFGHNELGLARETIRSDALRLAAALAVMAALATYRSHFGKHK
jgi:hypothetical protein